MLKPNCGCQNFFESLCIFHHTYLFPEVRSEEYIQQRLVPDV